MRSLLAPLAAMAWLAGTGCDLFRCQFGHSEDPNEKCSVSEEKRFVYDNLRDRYLFADQVPTLNLDEFESAEALLSSVRESVVPPDRFSYIQTRASSDRAAAGVVSGGLGVRLAWWPGEGLLLSRVFGTFDGEPSTPASEAGLRRGDVIVAVEGEPIGGLEPGEAVARLGPDENGVERSLRLRRPAGEEYQVMVKKRPYQRHTVPVVRDLGNGVGYILFEAFLERSEGELNSAFRILKGAGVRRVVLDLRWNGGGRGSTSRHLLGLLLGGRHEGKRAYVHRFNEEYDGCTDEFELEKKDESLSRVDEVAIITGPGTASASELVWNVLRPYAKVFTVGASSIGKPYGFYPYDFCGKVLRAVNYRRENAAGQAVPVEGIEPACEAYDQVTAPLGDPEENLLALALLGFEGRGCPKALVRANKRLVGAMRSAESIVPLGHEWTFGAEPGVF